ncbi:MAG: tyrosine--tRNA ligase [Pseudomonadota bacterium]|nr:tyrosine--tRNA ligase [Pseudomonadota bacterium]
MSFKPKSEFLTILTERGFVQDVTNIERLDDLLSKKKVVGYIGYDATAGSLHVGHLLNIMILRWMQKCGHTPITLMGGGTTKVGDPSFRSTDRPLLSERKITSNINSLNKIFEKYLSYENLQNNAVMVNNSDWLESLNYLQFLRDIGRHFSVNRMLSFDSIKSRIDREQSLSFLEFNYMILQAYDFLELQKRFGCILQIGGSDQWGNIVNGIDLTRRVLDKTVYGLTCPLLTTSSGLKMGKTQNGAIWLNANLTSPYEFWQFWRNTEDEDVVKFMKLFTEIPLTECKKFEKLEGSEINDAKDILATEITSLCHGIAAAKAAKETAKRVFSDGEIGESLPTTTLTKQDLSEDLTLIKLFLRSGLVSSSKQMKRLISEGSAKVGGIEIKENNLRLSDIEFEDVLKLSIGKKRHALIKK